MKKRTWIAGLLGIAVLYASVACSDASDGDEKGIINAVTEGDTALVRSMLKDDATLAKTKHPDGQNLLYMAALKERLDIAEMLLDLGVELHPEGQYVPLQSAANRGDLEMVKLLISRGADVNWKNEHGRTALHAAASAASYGAREVFDFLLTNGGKLDTSDLALLEAATRGGLSDIVNRILEDNPSIAPSDLPLRDAARGGHCEILELFLERGANVNAESRHGATALSGAAVNGHLDAARLLIAAGADVNAGTNPPICEAAGRGGSLELVQLLLGHGAEMPKSSPSLLHYAARGDRRVSAESQAERRAIVKLCLENGMDVNDRFEAAGGVAPLHLASQKGSRELVEQLIAAGAEIDALDKGGRSPLGHAAVCANLEAAEALLEHGASINPDGVGADSALHSVVHMSNLAHFDGENRIKLLELLLEQEPDVNALDSKGYTPLHNAVAWGYDSPEMVEMLLAYGADPSIADSMGRTAVDLAENAVELRRQDEERRARCEAILDLVD